MTCTQPSTNNNPTTLVTAGVLSRYTYATPPTHTSPITHTHNVHLPTATLTVGLDLGVFYEPPWVQCKHVG